MCIIGDRTNTNMLNILQVTLEGVTHKSLIPDRLHTESPDTKPQSLTNYI